MKAKTAGEIVVLQHVECEPPGTYTPFLDKRADLAYVRLDLDGAAGLAERDPKAALAVVAMGGPMGVYETTAYPWIVNEVRFIADAVDAGVPVLGICLGAQLLARALGGDVFAGPRAEVEVGRISLTPDATADPVLGGLRPSFLALQWHSDTFTLPKECTLLASSDLYTNQAFCRGSAYGIQFHSEANWALASEWLAIPAYRQSITDALGPEGPDVLARDMQAAESAMTATADHIVERWLTTFVDPRLP